MRSDPSRGLSIPSYDLSSSGFSASVLALGTSAFGSFGQAAPVYDQYAASGGNFFDTAWIYGMNYEPGCCERVLGSWMTRRGVTEQMRALVKGGHPPHCRPEALAGQLAESLDRLQRSTADLYMLHRDDTSVPAGEFVDVLWSFVEGGRATAYGFSNWTINRVVEAIAYARNHDYAEPAALSNQLSLAVVEQPVYPGCVSVADPISRQWLEDSKFTLIPWSSQGRGVFTRVAERRDLEFGDLAGSWFSPGNWERVQRARTLAAERDVLPVNIALAWVMQQRFPTFPVIGPRATDELLTALGALDVALSTDEMAWLNLERDARTDYE